jgi:hypothetical protein
MTPDGMMVLALIFNHATRHLSSSSSSSGVFAVSSEIAPASLSAFFVRSNIHAAEAATAN